MPRIVKKLPTDRANYSFGDLVYWHVLKFGTRPNIDPSARTGRPWRIEQISAKLGKTSRTLRNWINDESLPEDVAALCMVLFGDNPRWDDARAELQERYERALAHRRISGVAPSMSHPAPEVGAADNKRADTPKADARLGDTSRADESAARDEADAESESDAEPSSSHRPPNAAGSRELVLARPIRLRAMHDNSGGQGTSRYRRALASTVAGVCVFFGLYAWLVSIRQPKTPEPVVPEVASAPEPKKRAEPPKPPLVVEPAPVPPVPEPRKEAVPKPPAPTEEVKRAEVDRLERAHMEARREAYEREKEAREAEALRLDRENDRRARDLASRDNDARTVAGMGYRIQEHRRIAGSSYAHVLAATVGDCAVACTGDPSCDAFGFYREEYGPDSKRRRVCYLFKKPFEVANYPGYVHGEPIVSRRDANAGEQEGGTDKLLIRVQARKSEPKTDDGLIRCATGPVKVSGFKISCDQTLGGGTTLGSTRLSYTVANINDCAAKCRPVQKCVGFTFNAGDREGEHACIIFGPTPEARESKGWIAGTR